jgi:hypothetical protein
MEHTAVIQRNFSVRYSQTSEIVWLAHAELQDEQHNIITQLEIRVPELTIQDASIEFKRQPLEQCREICQKAKALIGVPILHDLSTQLDHLFRGAEGCPNVRNLFGISGPGFIYVYYPKLIQEGKMTQMEWWKFVGSELQNECLAHKRLHKQYRPH